MISLPDRKVMPSASKLPEARLKSTFVNAPAELGCRMSRTSNFPSFVETTRSGSVSSPATEVELLTAPKR